MLGRIFGTLVIAALAAASGCDRKQPSYSIPVCDAKDVNCHCMLAGWVICDHVCVNPQFDSANCGLCGRSCGAQYCFKGQCSDGCGGGIACGDNCLYADDPANCGACGVACDTPCIAGKCSPPGTRVVCTSGLTDCNGACVKLLSDNRNCGSCGNQCYTDANEFCCSGACSFLDDRQNCGTCGHTCPSNTYCIGGSCQ